MKTVYLRNSLVCITLALCMSLVAEKNDFEGKVVKYVQGGACESDKGTKKHPYSSLAQAQADTSWEVLVVLSSDTPLDGGITLKPGQSLIGDTCPTGRILSHELPVITNLTGMSNGGNGVVVTGDAHIENIYFQDTFASAINYDKAVDLTVRNILITGHNQGAIDGAAGIKGTCAQSGSTCIENVVIHHNFSGDGMADIVTQGAHRTLRVNDCELYSLSAPGGIFVRAQDPNTSSDATIKNCYLHNFISPFSSGVIFATDNSAVINVIVKEVSFLDIVGTNGGYHIQSLEGGTVSSSTLNLKVSSCTFEETKLPVFPENAVYIQNYNSASDSKVTIENSRSTNLSNFVVSANFDDLRGSTQKVHILDNLVQGINFYQAFNSGALAGSHGITETSIKDNSFRGSLALEVVSSKPWTRLSINACDNCFIGSPGNSNALLSRNEVSDAGFATIYAKHNTFDGFAVDIRDTTANVNYIVPHNWWGATSPCPPACGPYQICSAGRCLGPDTVLVEPGYTGTIVTTDPLEESIKCPHACCPPRR